MLHAHIPVERSVTYASETITYSLYRDPLQTIFNNISMGKTISSTMHLYPKLFPLSSIQLIEVGEMSGNLSETLLYLSTMLDQEIEHSLKIMVSLIEPVLMVGMGFVVGFISLSIISPIYEITQNIKH